MISQDKLNSSRISESSLSSGTSVMAHLAKPHAGSVWDWPTLCTFRLVETCRVLSLWCALSESAESQREEIPCDLTRHGHQRGSPKRGSRVQCCHFCLEAAGFHTRAPSCAHFVPGGVLAPCFIQFCCFRPSPQWRPSSVKAVQTQTSLCNTRTSIRKHTAQHTLLRAGPRFASRTCA